MGSLGLLGFWTLLDFRLFLHFQNLFIMKKVLLNLLCIFSISTVFGQGWSVVGTSTGASAIISYISVPDQNAIWGLTYVASGATQEFTRSTDGGANWSGGNIPDCSTCNGSDIFALDANTAWAALFDNNGGGKVFKTSDGGSTWTHQATAAWSAAAGSFPDIIHFFNANEGVTMGDPTGGYFEIYTTTDGGDNWVRVPQADIAANESGEFGIVNVMTALGDNIWFGTNKGRIYKSADKGLHWTVSDTPLGDVFVGAIAFKDANNGFAVSSDQVGTNNIIQTTDGGATWTLMSSNTGSLLFRNGFTYVPGTPGTFMLGSSQGSGFSTDDCNTWVTADALVHTEVQFVNSELGWSGGTGGSLFKWEGPVEVSCVSLLGDHEALDPVICSGENLGGSIHLDLGNLEVAGVGVNANIYDETGALVNSQVIPDVTAAGFTTEFIPDAGSTTVGTFNYAAVATINPTFAGLYFQIQAFPSQCPADTISSITVLVLHDITDCAVVNNSDCAATVDVGGCPPSDLLTYDFSYTVDGGAPQSGDTFEATQSGSYEIIFSVDNGGCVREFSQSVLCEGVSTTDISAGKVTLSPNPAADQVTVSYSGTDMPAGMRLTDLVGRVVNTTLWNGNHAAVLAIGNMAQGLYILELQDREGKVIGREKLEILK